jgi:hypothetical protein
MFARLLQVKGLKVGRYRQLPSGASEAPTMPEAHAPEMPNHVL